jgi:glycosyltransferase involved in cell wall biosynthesis
MMQMFRGFRVQERCLALIYPFNLGVPDPNVSLPSLFQAFFKHFNQVIVSVNLLEPEYDIDMQIEALGYVLQKNPDSGLLIIGGGEQEERLRGLLATKTFSDNILLAGEVDRKYVIHMVASADVMIRTTRYDGDAISIRESMFLGTPVVATDTGLRPAGVDVVPVGDAKILAEKICKILSDAEIGTVARRVDTLMPSNENIEIVVDLYDELHRSANA